MKSFVFVFCIVISCCLHIINAGWVDPDSPEQVRRIRTFASDTEYELVMSDEFNRDGRLFKDGHDPMWTAIDRSDDDQTAQGRRSLQFYNSSNAFTANGTLIIKTTTDDTKWRGWNPYKKKYETMSRHFRSGMLQGWNKFCFTGGVFEVRVQFPGKSDVGGLWPAVWLMGNLGRATYEASTNLMWPWSYAKCDRKLQHAQTISGCDITNHYSLHPNQGRGATEIDVLEVMSGPSTALPLVKNGVKRPYVSMTLQLAPGIPAANKRPYAGTLPEWGFTWYKNITYGRDTSINPFFYGTYLTQTKAAEPIPRSKLESYQCDALSSMVQLGDDHFKNFHTFRIEWETGPQGYVRWYMDDVFRLGIDAEGLKEFGTQIPEEPSYIIMNTAISTSWGFPNPPAGCNVYDCKDPASQCGFSPGFCKELPAEFKIDYVRVYQNKNNDNHTIGCNPPKYPTRRYIQAHEYNYKGMSQAHAIEDIKHGKGKCKSHKDCGEGTCNNHKCQCKHDWIGPHCLVPDHQYDEPDWDKETWVPLSLPYIPSFLAVASMGFLLLLGLIAYYVMLKNREIYSIETLNEFDSEKVSEKIAVRTSTTNNNTNNTSNNKKSEGLYAYQAVNTMDTIE